MWNAQFLTASVRGISGGSRPLRPVPQEQEGTLPVACSWTERISLDGLEFSYTLASKCVNMGYP